MTTIELAKKLDLEVLQINESDYTKEELQILQQIGRIVRNLQLLNSIHP